MHVQAQRMAIAEAMGGYRPDGFGQPPDFLNDLTAMHRAEELILGNGNNKWAEWEQQLGSVVMRERKTNHAYLSDMCHSSAAERAEALLKTIGKWID